MASRKLASPASQADDAAAAALSQAIRRLGHYAHVEVRAHRGHLNIYPGDDEPVARLSPLGGSRFGLSFHSHTGRWEQMPFAGPLDDDMARTIVNMLGPYLSSNA